MSTHQLTSPDERRGLYASGAEQVINAVIVGGVVLAVSLFGILLRPQGLLSAFWPANAVLLGLMLRRPSLATPVGWASAVVGYFAADLLTGGHWEKTSLLTAGNLAGVIVGYLLFIRLDANDRSLTRPSSTIYFLLIIMAASVAVGLIGAVVNPILFNGSSIDGFSFWAVTELVNYIAILPVILTVPSFRPSLDWLSRIREACRDLKTPLPVLTYLLALAIEPVIGGPGALTFPVPSLLWCALSYRLSTTTLLSLSFTMWTLVAVSMGYVSIGATFVTESDLMSLRLGVMLIAFSPITVASIMAARNELLQETVAARKAAEDAMAARSLLLATMTHELRSPLTAVIGFSNLIATEMMGPIENPKYIDYAQSIGIAGNHLCDLVTDLLDTAKVEAGKIELSLAVVSSRDLVEQSLRLVRGLATEAEIDLVMEPGSWPDIHADSRAIKQVLINLLSNALKFSPQKTSVRIMTDVSPDRLTISIKDSGKGISAGDLVLLGRAYAQSGDTESRRQGTGLGLALSSQLIERHGGRLRLESHLGVGTTAIFDLALMTSITVES